jgi:hypothetical protein
MTEEIDICGEIIVLREFDFLAKRKASALVEKVLDDLVRVVISQRGTNLDILTMAKVFESHNETFAILLGMAARRPVEWIHVLSGIEGRLLTRAFWSVHSSYFSRLFFRRLALACAGHQRSASNMAPANNSRHQQQFH